VNRNAASMQSLSPILSLRSHVKTPSRPEESSEEVRSALGNEAYCSR